MSLKKDNQKKIEKESNKKIKELDDKIKKIKTLIDKSNHVIKTKCIK